jgi:hypothetical protein
MPETSDIIVKETHPVYVPGTRAYVTERLSELYPDEIMYHTETLGFKIGGKNLNRLLNSTLLQDFKKGEGTLLFYLFLESGFSYLEYVYDRLIVAHDIPSHRVLFIVSSIDEVKHNFHYAEKLNVPPVRTLLYDYYEQWVKVQIKDNIDHYMMKESPLTKTHLTKDFIFLNRDIRDQHDVDTKDHFRIGMRRTHRKVLFYSLAGKNLLGRGYVSFPKCYGDNLWTDKLHPELKRYVVSGKNMNVTLPLTLDDPIDEASTESIAFSNYLLSSKRPLDYYLDNSFVNIVPETHFYTSVYDKRSCRFLTEKTFLPISSKIPFIIVSVPNTLELLKDMGYKTFDGLIDESYDKELDDDSRLVKIINEVERLCNLDAISLDKLKKEMLPIVEHNFNNFMSKKNYIKEYRSYHG